MRMVHCEDEDELRFKFILCSSYKSVTENVMNTRMLDDFVQVILSK